MATTATGNYVCDNSSLANFKSWSMAISAAFSAFGWVQTADTGQVNWSSIGAVPSSAYVYEVWRANDTAAATLPIYVKVEYGFSATSPRLRITVGTGSSGAGVITGSVISSAPWEVTYSSQVSKGATTFPCFFSGDAGEFRAYLWQSSGVLSTPPGCLFGIERSKDASGVSSAEYVTILALNVNTTGTCYQQTILPAGLVANRESGVVGLALTAGSSTGLFNGTVAALPAFPVYGKVGNPMLGYMTCVAADVADGALVTVAAMYGGTHSYVAASAYSVITAVVGARSTQGVPMALLMRYE